MRELNNRLVTLIGGGGFIGRYVAQALLTAGARVRVAQRDPRQAWFLKPLGGLGQTQFIGADVRRPETIARAVAGADAVVNLVGVMTGDFYGIHVEGARSVAQAARAAGVDAMVQLSAIGADPDSPIAYARTKGLGEAAVREVMSIATVLRPSVVFGPEDQFLNRFARMARAPILPVLRAPARFQPVFAGDVADAVMEALADPERHGGRTYELGGPDVMTMGEINRFVADATGRSPRIVEIPDAVGALIARAGALPGAPISWDQWRLLQQDSVVAADAPGLDALGVTPTPLTSVAPDWLVRYHRAGRFGRRARFA